MTRKKVTAYVIAATMLISTVCAPSVSFADTAQDKENAASELLATQKEKDDLLEKYDAVKSEYETAVTEKKEVQGTLAKAEKEFADAQTDLDHSFTIERTGATSLIKYKQDLIDPSINQGSMLRKRNSQTLKRHMIRQRMQQILPNMTRESPILKTASQKLEQILLLKSQY